MYDAHEALVGIDAHTAEIMTYLLVTVAAAFLYFAIAFRIAIKQKIYVVPFIGSALFFWHDFTYVCMYDKWFHVYDHWWVKLWWFALVGTVIFELLMIAQVYQYGQKELWPGMSRRAFGALLVSGTFGIGAMWWLVKASLGDELFFITFEITAVFSVPFHTAIMARRQSRAGQSAAMELATIVMLWCEWGAFSKVAPFFTTAPMIAFMCVFTIWPLANIWLMQRLPATSSVTGPMPVAGRVRGDALSAR